MPAERAGLAALLALTVLRLVVAATVPLSADEAYYWVWSRALAPGYLDHPPMVALWIAAGTALLGEGALGVRLLGPLAAAAGSVLLALAARDLLDGEEAARRRAGVVAAVLLNATLMFGIGSVTMTPDTPLLFFWTVALWALGRLQATGQGGWWLLAGLAAGLAGASKYSAVLMLPAVLWWLLAGRAAWLRRWQPWAGAALGGLVLVPVLAWNAGHGWVSLIKQAGRGGEATLARTLQFQGELLGGQLGLATPIIAVLAAAGVWAALRQGRALLAGLSAVPLLVFAWHGLGERVQANWLGVVYPAACLAAAGLGVPWRRWVRPGVALGLAMTAVAYLQGALAPVALPMRLDPTLLRLGGWKALADEVAAVARREGAGFVASDNYGHAALLARLLPPDIAVVGMEGRWALFALPDATPAIAGRTGLLLRSTRRDDRVSADNLAALAPVADLLRARGGMVAEGFRLYRGVGQAGVQPAALMPRIRETR